jgi:hypothetical protein
VGNSRSPFQDVFVIGYSTTFTYAYPFKSGVYSGKAALPVIGSPDMKSGATTIENRKAVGLSTRLGGRGFEYQTGHKVPATTWEFDVTPHNIIQPLKSFFHSTGYTFTSNGQASYVTFKHYTDPNTDRYLTLGRKINTTTAHRMSGVVTSQIRFSGNENEAFKASCDFIGQNISYTSTYATTWHSAIAGDDDTFDTTQDPLLWKDANIAIGSVYEAPYGVTATLSGNTITVTGAPALTTLVEAGSYFVYSGSTTKYGPIATVGATTLTLETGSWTTFSNQGQFKIINFFHLPGIDLTITNNAQARAYNETSINRIILGDLTGSGTINIPYGEIAPATGGTNPGYTGSAWMNLFLEGGVVPIWIWWGSPYDCVNDSIGEGDLGFSFAIRATDSGLEVDGNEIMVAIPFDMIGMSYASGTVASGPVAGTGGGGYVSGTGTEFIALGSDVLATDGASAISINRGDGIKVSTSAEVEVSYVASTTYAYTLTAVASNVSGSYRINREAIRIRLGTGGWNIDASTM